MYRHTMRPWFHRGSPRLSTHQTPNLPEPRPYPPYRHYFLCLRNLRTRPDRKDLRIDSQRQADKNSAQFQVRSSPVRQFHSRLEPGGNMFNARERSITFFASLFIACLLLSAMAIATPSITLSKKSGPPTSQILVSGLGFAPNVGVDIFFDTKDEALVVTN